MIFKFRNFSRIFFFSLRIFLILSSFGFFLGIFHFVSDISEHSFLHALTTSVILSVFTGFAFSFFMSVILIPRHYYLYKKIIDENYPPSSLEDINQSKIIILNARQEDTFLLFLEILMSISDFEKIVKKDTYTQMIALTKKTSKSYGEKITLKFTQVEEEKTKIEIQSNPLHPFTLLDYGKNYNNIISIINTASNEIKNRKWTIWNS